MSRDQHTSLHISPPPLFNHGPDEASWTLHESGQKDQASSCSAELPSLITFLRSSATRRLEAVVRHTWQSAAPRSTPLTSQFDFYPPLRRHCYASFTVIGIGRNQRCSLVTLCDITLTTRQSAEAAFPIKDRLGSPRRKRLPSLCCTRTARRHPSQTG